MAYWSNDNTYLIVEQDDTLWDIADYYLDDPMKYKFLATINEIPNPDKIYVGQHIYLDADKKPAPSKDVAASKAIIKQFGLQSNAERTLFATWTWSKESKTESYQVSWTYSTGDGVWFVKTNSAISIDEHDPSVSRQSTCDIPSNAVQVRFKVKPIPKVKKQDRASWGSSAGKVEYEFSNVGWSDIKTYDVSAIPPAVPTGLTVDYVNGQLTMELNNLDMKNAEKIQFQIVKDHTNVVQNKTLSIKNGRVAYAYSVVGGSEYKVRCRAIRGGIASNWSDYSNSEVTLPYPPYTAPECKATSDTSVYLEWPAVKTAVSYEIEYTTNRSYFDGSDGTQTVSGIEFTHYEKTGLETGKEYFFRVRAKNSQGESKWSEISSVIIGKEPGAPTTWSSTTTAIVGESLILYWAHNAQDGSSQTLAELELTIDGVTEPAITIRNSTDEDEKDKVSSYVIDTSVYTEGTKILWRVRTKGVYKNYGDWSIQRTVDVYARPALELSMTDINGDAINVLTSFPFYVHGLAGPSTQAPIGYYLTITADEQYETTDNIGNAKLVKPGDQVYAKYFDISDPLLVEFSAGNVDLENNIKYLVTCIVSMNSGLTAESTTEFSVTWDDVSYEPDAEVIVDNNTLTTNIRPFCSELTTHYYKVEYSSGEYLPTTEELGWMYGEIVEGATVPTGEQVYSGVTSEGEDVYYCVVNETTQMDGILLSVYRREFDGSFTELATDIDSSKNTFITDPHPSLDYARYRIVAKTATTGAIAYSDIPGIPINEKAVVIQWDEEWSEFDTYGTDDAVEERPWTGSMLKLMYNIDVSDNHSSDVQFIKYAGRKRPVAYYGTQLGETSTWAMAIDKSDKDTLYALRRLAIWTGDVYVREPSGSGYWASISVSFSQKHRDLTIPVSLDITRVEGGA